MRRLLFSIWYWLRRPPWDTGVTPPELVRFVSAHSPGRALDLGCGTGTNVVVVVVLVVVVVVGTQTVLSAAQAARTCCTHCWLHFVLAFPLKFLQPAVAWHASIPSPQTLRRHGGEAAMAEAVSAAATARSTNLVSIFRAVIVPRLQRAPAASSSRLTLLPVAVREQLVRA